MGAQKQNFQPVEIWILFTGMIDMLEHVSDANHIYSNTVTTIIFLHFSHTMLNTSDFNRLKTFTDANKLKLGVYLEVTNDPCASLKTLSLKHLDMVYLTNSIWSLAKEFETCLFEIEKQFKEANTTLGFTSYVKSELVFGKAGVELHNQDYNQAPAEYIQRMSQFFHTPTMIKSSDIGVQTENGTSCYNASDVFEWVSDTPFFSKQPAGIFLPFDLVTFNITVDTLTTLLLSSPKIVLYNIHSFRKKSLQKIHVFFQTLKSATFRLSKTHGTNFASRINITVFLNEHKNDTFNEQYKELIFQVIGLESEWKATLPGVIHEIAFLAKSFLGFNSMHEMLKNATGQKRVSFLQKITQINYQSYDKIFPALGRYSKTAAINFLKVTTFRVNTVG